MERNDRLLLPILQPKVAESTADAKVVAQFYDGLLLRLVTWFLRVHSLHCLGSGTFP